MFFLNFRVILFSLARPPVCCHSSPGPATCFLISFRLASRPRVRPNEDRAAPRAAFPQPESASPLFSWAPHMHTHTRVRARSRSQ